MDSYFLRQNTHLGKEETEKIKNSSVCIVGLGGLGSGVAQILARMGVGKLILFDKDKVEEHNLSRQQLYTINDVGNAKVESAKKHLKEINPKCEIITIKEFADKENLKTKKFDLIVDCTDRHGSRRIIDSFCQENNISWIHGAAIREEGVVCVFDPKNGPLKSYEEIYKGKEKDEFCEGVIATTTNIVSSLQASLVIKKILGKQIPKGLMRINLDLWSFEELKIKKN